MSDTFYRIQNTTTKEFLKTHRGKTIWTGPNHAKNAYNCHVGSGWRGTPKFDEQTDWVIVPVIMIPTDLYDRLTERDDWLGDLESAGVDNWDGIDYAHELRRERTGEED